MLIVREPSNMKKQTEDTDSLFVSTTAYQIVKKKLNHGGVKVKPNSDD